MNVQPLNSGGQSAPERTPGHAAPVLRDEESRELALLRAVEANPSASQRALAREMGVALGVVNACVRSLVRKGLIKIRGESNRSLTYHLTKSGVLRKSALAVEWTRNTVGFYRQARGHVAAQMEMLTAQGHRRAVIFGAAELTEIAVLVAPQAGIEVVGILAAAPGPLGERIAGIAVHQFSDGRVAGGPDLSGVDVIVIAEEATSEQRAALDDLIPGAEQYSLLGEQAGTEGRE